MSHEEVQRETETETERERERELELPELSLSDINFSSKVKSCGCYGTIWTDKKDRIVKIQLLQTGAYFNKTINKYYDEEHIEISKNEAKRKYYTTDFAKNFINKHSISLEEYNNELSVHLFMAENKIAPKIYKYGLTKLENGLQFCIIIMKRIPDVLSHNLDITDMTIVNDKIKKIHKLGYYHGDLQTCNIGIYIENDKIIKCRIFDWFYGGKLNEGEREREREIKSDWKLYKLRGGKL